MKSSLVWSLNRTLSYLGLFVVGSCNSRCFWKLPRPGSPLPPSCRQDCTTKPQCMFSPTKELSMPLSSASYCIVSSCYDTDECKRTSALSSKDDYVRDTSVLPTPSHCHSSRTTTGSIMDSGK